mgnify:CR=1 FL=1
MSGLRSTDRELQLAFHWSGGRELKLAVRTQVVVIRWAGA